MKKFAFYLPQFHEIPENNKWWGKGFTEWTNVKKAKPLFKGHCQPVHPLNDNYYNLMDVNTLKWQAAIAREYHIDGMIFYHYYFCGKKLLEKPSELLLNNLEIDMPFFFCWANHSWYRSWEGSKTMLMEQRYGKTKEWEMHFQYLLSFFKDDRYVKKNNKPLMMIYNPEFAEKDSIFEYFNKRCKDYGFDGIYVIDTISSLGQYNEMIKSQTKYERVFHLREPVFSLSLYRSNNNIFSRAFRKIVSYLKYGVMVIDGDKILKLRTAYKTNGKIIPGLFFQWDNSPRHGKRAFLIKAISKRTFEDYMEHIVNADFLFINAWNEWCEGMILEPTKEHGYQNLDWIKEWSENHE